MEFFFCSRSRTMLVFLIAVMLALAASGCTAPGKSQVHYTPDGKVGLAVNDGEANTIIVDLPASADGKVRRRGSISTTNPGQWLTMTNAGTEGWFGIPVSSGTIGGAEGMQFTDPSKASASGIRMTKYQPATYAVTMPDGTVQIVNNYFTRTDENGVLYAQPFPQHEFFVDSFNRDIGATLLAEAERQARALVPVVLAMEDTKRETFKASVAAIDANVGRALDLALAFASSGLSEVPDAATAIRGALGNDLDPGIRDLLEREAAAADAATDEDDSPDDGG